MARGLCPVYYTHGLVSSLEDLVTTTRMLHQVDCQLKANDGIEIKNHMVTINLYHIAGEAVRNAIRHGHATIILISMEIQEDQFNFRIQDNGRGMDPKINHNGMGLRIMNYRANIIGASFMISSDRKKGDPGKTGHAPGSIDRPVGLNGNLKFIYELEICF